MRNLFLILFCFFFVSGIFGQRNVAEESIASPMVGLHYSAILPAQDLADRFGFLNQVGLTAGYKAKNNWVFGVEGNFYFGNRVTNDSIFDFMRDNLGNISENEGQFAVVDILSRGFNIHAHMGKIIPVFGSNPNSGLYLSAGAGYSLMKYRIETTWDFVPLVEADNRRHYDRQTVGFSLSQFIGYSLINATRPIHFYTGFYFNQGFSRFSRSWFYDAGPAPTDLQIDLQFGIRAGWYVPIYKRKAKTIYFD